MAGLRTYGIRLCWCEVATLCVCVVGDGVSAGRARGLRHSLRHSSTPLEATHQTPNLPAPTTEARTRTQVRDGERASLH